jgi:hypothetical protein
MFKATTREVNHAIKPPSSKPTTTMGLRHPGRLATDLSGRLGAGARFWRSSSACDPCNSRSSSSARRKISWCLT